MAQPLEGKTVALLETRREDVLAQMFEGKGAEVFHCPLVEIVDAPETDAIVDWLRDFCAGAMDDLILLTGEGLVRLDGFATRANLGPDFLEGLARVRKIVRGPKPARALGERGLRPDLSAPEPTTEGLIELLRGEALAGRRVGVQLYDVQPNTKLTEFLREVGAEVRTVAPYRYAPASDDARIGELIDRLEAGRVDILPFTSAPQVRALAECAERLCRAAALKEGLTRTVVAAIGPVVRRELESASFPIDLTLQKNFFMGPLVNAVAEKVAAR